MDYNHTLSLGIFIISYLLVSSKTWFYQIEFGCDTVKLTSCTLALHVSLINIVILCGEETSFEITPSHSIANKRMKERTLYFRLFSYRIPAGGTHPPPLLIGVIQHCDAISWTETQTHIYTLSTSDQIYKWNKLTMHESYG